MLPLELGVSTLAFITFMVMLVGSVLGYFSLRRHVRRIELPPSDENAPD